MVIGLGFTVRKEEGPCITYVPPVDKKGEPWPYGTTPLTVRKVSRRLSGACSVLILNRHSRRQAKLCRETQSLGQFNLLAH